MSFKQWGESQRLFKKIKLFDYIPINEKLKALSM